MKLLNAQQIKQEELKLLQIDGQSLAQYAGICKYSFVTLSKAPNLPELNRLNIGTIKSAGSSPNANLQAFTYTLFHSIYRNEVKRDLLDTIKSSLYSSDIDLTKLKHSSISEISNIQMKKLLVQFLYSLSYSGYENKVESRFCKFPIVIEILVLFLRTILVHLGVNKSGNCLMQLPTDQTFQVLINFFDLNCRFQNNLFLFYEDRMFIAETEQKEIMVGTYLQNQVQLNENELENILPLSELQEQEQKEESLQKMHSSHNRSLELRGTVGESIVFSEQEASTPCFNLDNQSNSSFSSSMEVNTSQRGGGKQSLLKTSKEMSLIKMLDSKLIKRSDTFGNENFLKKTMYQNEIKRDLDQLKQGLQIINSSPIPQNSPHNLIFEGSFKPQIQEVSDEVKTLKRSKSEYGIRTPKGSEDIFENQKDESGKHTKKQQKGKHKCECNPEKKTKNKLVSNLYEINMNYVTHQSPDFYKKETSDVESKSCHCYGDFYVSSKGVSSEIYVKHLPKNQPQEKKHPKQTVNANTANHQFYETSNSCSVLPEKINPANHYFYKTSNSCSMLPKTINQIPNFYRVKTDNSLMISQRSINSDKRRSFSPCIEVLPVKLPKITFSYQSPQTDGTALQKSNLQKKS